MNKGRPANIKREEMLEAVAKYKNAIVYKNEKQKECIVPQTNPIWSTIYKELNEKVKISTLYSYVVNNKYGLKTILIGDDKVQECASSGSSDIDHKSNASSEDPNMMCTIVLPKSEYEGLLMETNKKYKDHTGKTRNRVVNVLQPGKWTEIVAKKLYDEFRLTHGFHFKNHYITKNGHFGKFEGHCKCGSKINCQIMQTNNHEDIVKIECAVSRGGENCGKRQCRGETRKDVVKELERISTEKYRSTKAAKLLNVGDIKEPPHLYKANVLHNIKYENDQKQFRDANAIQALSKLKRSDVGRNIVREISLDPVIVHFWSPHQTRLYNEILKTTEAYLCIDATGGIAKRYKHVDGKESQHIFLYLAVLYAKSCGQIAVSSCFSEAQDTVTINTWLRRWIQSGARFPKEVVCDSSKALLNACCWAFTGQDSIESYAEACMAKVLPRTKIEVDVAHYIKNWSNSLKSEKKVLKKFYLFAIGQLILSRSTEEANIIMKSLLIISLSETAGHGADSLKNALQFIQTLLKKQSSSFNEIETIIDKTMDENDQPNEDKSEEENIDVETPNTNGRILETWSTTLSDEVHQIIKAESGDDINPRFCPKFAGRLLQQIKTIPLWSCIKHDDFGYGRVPPSSAPVESEFKILKKQVITSPLRIDRAVEGLNLHYNGKLKIIDCALKKPNAQKKCMGDVVASTVIEDNNFGMESFSFNISGLDMTVDDELCNAINLSSVVNQLMNPINDEPLSCMDCKYGTQTEEMCVLCKESIHHNVLCSVPLEDKENADMRRLCKSCFNSSRREERIALNEIENWRNLGQPKTRTKQALYVTKSVNQDLNDIVLSSNCTALPILLNGNTPSLELVRLGKNKFTFNNTCAFDSIFQLVLAAVTDSEKMLNYVDTFKRNNPLFHLVLKVKNNRIQSSTYRERGEILSQFLRLDRYKNFNTINNIDCNCNVIGLTNFLFKNSPSFQEAAKCPAGCPVRVKILPTITILPRDLLQPLNLVLEKYIALSGVECDRSNCKAVRNNYIHEIADLIAIGLDTESDIEASILPRSFQCPITNSKYKLLGVVNYIGPTPLKRTQNEVGHYTAVTLRFGNWTVYDDMRKSSFSLNKNYKLHPELLFYGKI